MKKNLISIIVPYRRKKKFFQQTINSIKNQTYKEFELIIIYDDTKKLELNFVKKVIQKIKKKKIIVNKVNLGAGESRNKGIKHSNGEYICFCDADDLWAPRKIEKQLNIKKQSVRDILLKLEQNGVIKYKQNEVGMQLRFLQNRKDSEKLNISKEKILNEKKLAKEKLDIMIKYINNKNKCNRIWNN